MRFSVHVRKGQIAGPLRRKFDASFWSRQCAEIGEDAADRALHDAGLLIYRKAEATRALVKFVYSAAHSATTKVRAVVAMSNLFAVDTEKRMLARIADPEALVTQFDALTLKMELPIGAAYSPDEILQGVVDGCEI